MIGPPSGFDEKGQNRAFRRPAVQSRNRTPKVVLPAAAAAMAPVLPAPRGRGGHDGAPNP